MTILIVLGIMVFIAAILWVGFWAVSLMFPKDELDYYSDWESWTDAND